MTLLLYKSRLVSWRGGGEGLLSRLGEYKRGWLGWSSYVLRLSVLSQRSSLVRGVLGVAVVVVHLGVS